MAIKKLRTLISPISFRRFLRTRRRKVLATSLAILILVSSLRLFLNPKEVRADTLLKFDEGYGTTVNDSSGSASGTITGATWQTNGLCFDEMCLFFDGNDWISFGDEASFDFAAATDFTIEFWFRHSPASAAEVIIQKYEGTGGDGGYRIQMESDGDISFGVDDANGGFSDDNIITTAANYDNNRWHHVAAVKDGTTGIYLYIDSVLIVSDTTIGSTGDLTNDDTFYIGDSNGSDDSDEYIGFIDEVKIYTSTARTQAEINADVLGATKDRGTTAKFADDYSYLSDGLVGYWKMDESSWTGAADEVVDSSGNGNHGTAINSPTTTGGKFGNAGEFDGTNDRVEVTDDSTLDITEQVTISAWVYSTGAQERYAHVLAKNRSGSNAYPYVLSFQGEFDDKIYLTVGDSLASNTVSSNADIATNEWVHMAGTYDGNIIRLFINGAQQDDTLTKSFTITTNSQVVLIGGRTSTQEIAGNIDEARVYNRAFSPAEVSALYNWAPGPVGYWPMDEKVSGDSQTIYDLSSNGNNGTSSDGANNTGMDCTVAGRFGGGCDFDGADDIISTSDINDYDMFSGDSSFGAWVNFDDLSSRQIVIAKYEYAGEITDTGWFLEKFSSSSTILRISDGTNGYVYNISFNTSTYFTANKWHYLSFTFDESADTVTIYVDAQEVASSSSVATFASTDFGLGIGARTDDNDWNTFAGKIDEVKIYNYVRTQAQVIEDMNAGHPAPGSPIGSPIAHWQMDEGYGDTANDSGSGGNNGNLAGGTTCPQSGDSACPTWTNSGKFGKALDFEDSGATDDQVDIADNDALSFGDGSDDQPFSISMWANYETLGTGRELVSKYGLGQREYVLGHANASPYNLYFVFQDESLGDNNYIGRYAPSTNLTTGAWHHIATTYDGSESASGIKIYINGIREDTTDYVAGSYVALENNTSPLSIGFGDQWGGANFDGQLDEVKIYNFELTAAQIKLDMNQGKAAVWGVTSTDSSGVGTWDAANEYCPPRSSGTCTAPVGEWKFDEKTGTTANDTSGNGNSGAFSSSPVWTHAGECKQGACLVFDGIDDYLDVGDPSDGSLDFGTGDFTVSYWGKHLTAAGGGGGERAVSKRPGATGAGWSVGVGVSTGMLKFRIDDSSSSAEPNIGTTDWRDSKWHFFTFVFDRNDSMFGYVDGTFVASFSISSISGSVSNSSPFNINTFNNRSGDADDNVLLDQARVYNYARTQAQIAWEYNRGGPVGYWALDECSGTTANDSSGNGNNGTITAGDSSGDNDSVGTCDSGASDPTNEMWNDGTTGKRNASLGFDGTNDYVSVSDSTSLDTTADAFTLSAWIYDSDVNDGTDDDRNIMAKGDTGTTNNNTWILKMIDTEKLYLTIADGSSNQSFLGSAIISYQTWTHVAATFDGTDIRLYVNGALDDGPTSKTIGSLIDAGDVVIGRQSAADCESPYITCWDGQIDEVKIYNYALTQQQIRDNYNAGAAIRYGPDTGSP